MATIVFRVNELRSGWEKYPRLEIYHGDDVEIQFAQPYYQDWKNCFGIASSSDDTSHGVWMRCPEIQELPKENKFPMNGSYDNCYRVVEPSSECRYNPLEVWGWDDREFKDNLSCQGYSKDTYQEFISKFFDIPTFDELTEMCVASGYKMFVVKRNVKLKYTFVETYFGCRELAVVSGTPRKIPYEVRWTDRFESDWVKQSDVKRWKKFIKTYRWGGDNGLVLINIAYLHSDFGHPDNSQEIMDRMYSGEWLDYDEPSLYSEETKENRRRAEETKRKEKEKLESQKQLPGYCDICGREHAQYVNDPWREISGWFCHSCYSDRCGWEE